MNAASKPESPGPQPTRAKSERGLLCPSCDRLNARDRRTCKYCDAPLWTTCRKCGTENQTAITRCTKCLETLRRFSFRLPGAADGWRHPGVLAGIAFAGIVALTLGFIAVRFIFW